MSTTIKNLELHIQTALEDYSYNDYPEVGIREYTDNNYRDNPQALMEFFGLEKETFFDGLTEEQQEAYEDFLDEVEASYEPETECLVCFEKDNRVFWIDLLLFESKEELQEHLAAINHEGAKIVRYISKFTHTTSDKEVELSPVQALQNLYESEEFDKFLELLDEKSETFANGVQNDDIDALMAILAEYEPETVEELRSLVKSYNFEGEWRSISKFVRRNELYDLERVSEDNIDSDDEDARIKKAVDIAREEIFSSQERESLYYRIIKENRGRVTYLVFGTR